LELLEWHAASIDRYQRFAEIVNNLLQFHAHPVS